jgi:biopolymer transport protein TolR
MATARRKLRRVVVAVPRSGLSSAINITPLVDVVLVLLIIFMVVTPLLERQIDVRVPQTRVSTSLPAEAQLVVTIDADNHLAIDGVDVEAGEYAARLPARLAERSADDKSVFFIAHDKSGYRTLVRAIDDAKAAGAVRVGMVTD